MSTQIVKYTLCLTLTLFTSLYSLFLSPFLKIMLEVEWPGETLTFSSHYSGALYSC